MELVRDDEMLFRCVFVGRGGYLRDAAGDVRLTKMAFLDPNRRVSVDRSELCREGYRSTQRSPDDGVVELITSDVRATCITVLDAQGKTVVRTHALDVEAAPLADNLAHAEIVALPDLSNSQFHKMQQRLVAISTWKECPRDVRLHER